MALADYLDSTPETDLTAILKCTENILRNNIQNDRIVIPALEALAGLFEENIFSRVEESYKYICNQSLTDDSFRTVFILSQKVGYKSGNVMKLLACVRMSVLNHRHDLTGRYAALLSVESIGRDVLKKLLTMLLHPLPRVCLPLR